MRAYKYVKPDEAHYLDGNSLKIGSSATFAAMEDERSDGLEGKVSHTVHYLGVGPNHPDVNGDRAFLDSFFGARDPSARQVFRNVQFIKGSPVYAVLCLSHTPDNDYWLGQGRTVVFEIPDVEKLARWISVNYRDVLGRVAIKPVEYEAREFELPHGKSAIPDIFAKRPKFAPEDELRIAWEVHTPTFDHLIVSLDPLENLVRRCGS